MTAARRILITFARSYLTLELARLLNSQGHTVFVADSLTSPLTSFSNSVKQCFTVPSPRFSPQDFVDSLLKIVEKEKIDLLIPVYEEISCLSKAANLFPSTCKIFCPSFDLYDELQNKWLFQQKLKELGIPALKSFLIKNSSDLSNLPLKEYALKPCHSRASQFLYKVTPSNRPPSLVYESYNPWIAQEWATGNKFCTYSICYEGTINAHGVYPVSYAIGGNLCVVFEAVNHPKILQWITKFVRETNFTGQIAFDFIEPSKDELYAIECNPRATSGLLLFKPEDQLDKAFFARNQNPILPPAGRSQQVATGMLMYGWKKSAVPNNSLRKYLKTLLTTKDVILRTDDLKPFIFEPFIFGKLWLKSKQLGLTIPDFYLYDHAWNGEPIPNLT